MEYIRKHSRRLNPSSTIAKSNSNSSDFNAFLVPEDLDHPETNKPSWQIITRRA